MLSLHTVMIRTIPESLGELHEPVGIRSWNSGTEVLAGQAKRVQVFKLEVFGDKSEDFGREGCRI